MEADFSLIEAHFETSAEIQNDNGSHLALIFGGLLATAVAMLFWPAMLF